MGYFLISHTKINSKWVEDLNVGPETTKLVEESMAVLSDIGHRNIFSDILLRQGGKIKSKQMEWHQTKKLLHSEGNYQQNEKLTHRMGEDTCKWYIW